jgi:hypothetical protein
VGAPDLHQALRAIRLAQLHEDAERQALRLSQLGGLNPPLIVSQVHLHALVW